MFGQIGMSELLVILVIVLLVFGPKKLPELARGIGRGINEFRRAAEDVKQELNLDDNRLLRSDRRTQPPPRTIPKEIPPKENP